MSDRPHRRRLRGHTLVETTVSAGVLMTLAGGLFSMLRDSGAMFGESVRIEQQRREVDDTLARLARELEQANGDTLIVDRSAPDGDTLRLQLPLDLTANPPTFGATTDVGGRALQHPGAQVIWTTRAASGGATRTLVRRVIASDGQTLLAEEEVCSDLDLVRTDGTKSFIVDVPGNGSLATLTLRRIAFVAIDPSGSGGTSSNGDSTRCHTQTTSVRILSR